MRPHQARRELVLWPRARTVTCILFSFYFAVAVTGAVAGSWVLGALSSAVTAVMCRARNSGTVAVGISARGSWVIGALDGVTWSRWKPVRAPRVRAVARSVRPNALNHKAARRPPPRV